MLPAHAGTVPSTRSGRSSSTCAPRARGDGPPRGEGRPVGGGCSPRTRGWSRDVRDSGHQGLVLPAHAGMVPTHCPQADDGHSAPRARGDGPGRIVVPETYLVCSRARGDGPVIRAWPPPPRPCSPRTRGWSPAVEQARVFAFVLPAYAGMVRAALGRHRHVADAPRVRGDGPGRTDDAPPLDACSPRTRGWSRPDDSSRGKSRAPRVHGDGPADGPANTFFDTCSPARAYGPSPA